MSIRDVIESFGDFVYGSGNWEKTWPFALNFPSQPEEEKPGPEWTDIETLLNTNEESYSEEDLD